MDYKISHCGIYLRNLGINVLSQMSSPFGLGDREATKIVSSPHLVFLQISPWQIYDVFESVASQLPSSSLLPRLQGRRVNALWDGSS